MDAVSDRLNGRPRLLQSPLNRPDPSQSVQVVRLPDGSLWNGQLKMHFGRGCRRSRRSARRLLPDTVAASVDAIEHLECERIRLKPDAVFGNLFAEIVQSLEDDALFGDRSVGPRQLPQLEDDGRQGGVQAFRKCHPVEVRPVWIQCVVQNFTGVKSRSLLVDMHSEVKRDVPRLGRHDGVPRRQTLQVTQSTLRRVQETDFIFGSVHGNEMSAAGNYSSQPYL